MARRFRRAWCVQVVMARSMTGFGRAENESDGLKAAIEVKSVNHRFLEISIKSGGRTIPFDDQIRKTIRDYFFRGYFEIIVTLRDAEEEGRPILINDALLDSYMKVAADLKERYGFVYPPTFGEIISIKEMIAATSNDIEPKRWWKVVEQALKNALGHLAEGRETEGLHLVQIVQDRFDIIGSLLKEIESIHEKSAEQKFEKLQSRIKKQLENAGLEPDNARLLQEVAILVDRSDVSEEQDRIKSHLTQVADLIKTDGPIGRKLEFFVQEINREINTLGSKTTSPEATAHVVEIKSELEKIREQSQNIE